MFESMSDTTTTTLWIWGLGVAVVIGLFVFGAVVWAYMVAPAWADGRDLEPELVEVEVDDYDRSTNPALDERLTVWQAYPEPVVYRGGSVSHRPDAPLGLFGRMRAAVSRVMHAPTRMVPVVAIASVEPEPEEPTGPIPSPLDPAWPVPSAPPSPVDTWRLLGYQRPAWDVTPSSQWEQIDVTTVMDPGPEYEAEVLARQDAQIESVAA